MRKEHEFKISNFFGVNLRDSVDKIQNNEFVQLQNVWQPNKATLARRFGSTSDVSSIPLASRISAVWRHNSGLLDDRKTLYFCAPDTTQFPDNTTDLVLTEVADGLGTIFDGDTAGKLRFCYSWIGSGLEQTYNSKGRESFPSLPVNAWSNPAHQSITPASNTSSIQVTVPAFPSGVRGANIFVSRDAAGGNPNTQMNYIGTVVTSGGSLLYRRFIGDAASKIDDVLFTFKINNPTTAPTAGAVYTNAGQTFLVVSFEPASGTLVCRQTASTRNGYANYPSGQLEKATGTGDAFLTFTNSFSKAYVIPGSITGATASDGALRPGSYYISLAWCSDCGLQEGEATAPHPNRINVGVPTLVSIAGGQNAITVVGPASASYSGGAVSAYVFIGTKDPTIAPMTCVGIVNLNETLTIKSIPSHNAQSCPDMLRSDAFPPQFDNSPNTIILGGFNNGNPTARISGRYGFLMAKDSSGTKEIFPSRSLLSWAFTYISQSAWSGDNNTNGNTDYHNWAGQPRTQNDSHKQPVIGVSWQQPFSWTGKVTDPQFCYFQGMSYFVNGIDLPWMTDGYTLGQLPAMAIPLATQPAQTLLPPPSRFISVFKSSLLVSGALSNNQLFASNANNPSNWAVGGLGAANRYVIIGDVLGGGVTAMGTFTPQTEATSDPNSFIIGFKKNGCWMIKDVPDPSAGVASPMVQVSGRVGCVAYRSVVNTPLGTAFLAQDGNVYLIRAVSEPYKIGTKIQNALQHLVGNDDAMRACTATFHGHHYKLSYPSVAAAAVSPIVCDSEWWADLRTEDNEPIRWVGPHVGRSIGAQVVSSLEGDDGSRLCADGAVARTFKADDKSTYTDLGSPIQVKIKSKIFRFDNDAHSKRVWGAILDLYIDSSFTNDVLMEVTADEFYNAVNRQLSNGGATWDASLFDQSGYSDSLWQAFSFLFGSTNLVGRTIQMTLTSQNAAPLVVAGISFLLKPERRRITL